MSPTILRHQKFVLYAGFTCNTLYEFDLDIQWEQLASSCIGQYQKRISIQIQLGN